jgi:predicted nucleic acid-binding protein
MLFLIDTNFYIRAIQEAVFGAAFREWHKQYVPSLAMSAVVLHELLVGAQDVKLRHRIQSDYAERFLVRRRLLAPSNAVWERAAAADTKLRQEKQYAERLILRGFANDLLIALTAREIGATVLTANSDDFDLIASVTGVRHRPVLPHFGETE